MLVTESLPRYLITAAAAEFLYDAVAQWKARHSLTIDSTSLAFFKDIYPAATIRVYKSGNSNSPFAQITAAITTYADSFAAIAQKYTPDSGQLDEQFERATGTPLSATDLTWSYAAFLTMSQRRSGQYPSSWGSRRAQGAPATCASASTTGAYAPATAAGAPDVPSSCQVSVSFNVNASTYYGENVYVVGNTPDLGSWNVDNSYPMGAGGYTSERPLWSLSAYLTAGEELSYVYVRQENCGQAWIYESGNRTLVAPPCGSAGIVTDDAWVGPVGTSGGC